MSTQFETIDGQTGEITQVDTQHVPATIAPLDIGAAIRFYRSVQAELDEALPDCTMSIRGKMFRKKSYWRAIARAFRLNVTLSSERREVIDGDPVWFAVARASEPSGLHADGDGACAFSEGKGSEHNTRSTAITRAKNRAISDLVGFGEVSAEEINEDDRSFPKHTPAPSRGNHMPGIPDADMAELNKGAFGSEGPDSKPVAPPNAGKPVTAKLSTNQVAKLTKGLEENAKDSAELLQYLGYEPTATLRDILREEVKAAVAWIQS